MLLCWYPHQHRIARGSWKNKEIRCKKQKHCVRSSNLDYVHCACSDCFSILNIDMLWISVIQIYLLLIVKDLYDEVGSINNMMLYQWVVSSAYWHNIECPWLLQLYFTKRELPARTAELWETPCRLSPTCATECYSHRNGPSQEAKYSANLRGKVQTRERYYTSLRKFKHTRPEKSLAFI